MAELGYDRYGAQGGDWGSVVSANVADLDAAHVAGLHLNFVAVGRPEGDTEPLTDAERQAMDDLHAWRRTGAGYQEIQGTKPQTARLRPGGLAGRARRVDHREVPVLERLRRRRRAVLHQGPAAHQRHGVLGHRRPPPRRPASTTRCAKPASRPCPRSFIGVPTGIAQYPAEITKVPRRWVEQRYHVTHWAEHGTRRPFRRDGGARSVRRRPPPVLPHGAVTATVQFRRRSFAQRVSSWRVDSCSLRRTADTWDSTVLTEMARSRAISR